jgi:hypothetical protein
MAFSFRLRARKVDEARPGRRKTDPMLDKMLRFAANLRP